MRLWPKVLQPELHIDVRFSNSDSIKATSDPAVRMRAMAWFGLTEDPCLARRASRSRSRGLSPWNASGCAIANGSDEADTKLLLDNSPDAHGQGSWTDVPPARK